MGRALNDRHAEAGFVHGRRVTVVFAGRYPSRREVFGSNHNARSQWIASLMLLPTDGGSPTGS